MKIRVLSILAIIAFTASCSNAQEAAAPAKPKPSAAAPAIKPWLLPAKHVNHDKYYERRATHFGYLPTDSDDIIMFGNSLTDGAEFNELLGNPNVKNRGIIGDIIPGLIDRLEPVVAGHPAKIFILAGVNDISHNVGPDSVARDMDRLLTEIKRRSPQTRIYLQSLLPFNNNVQMWKYLKDKEQEVVQTNALYEKLAKKHGVTWINLYPLFDDGTGRLKAEYTNDGLHLMGKGYIIWRDAILPYVNE